MSDHKPPPRPINEGYQPATDQRGYKPAPVRPSGTSNPQGGHIPTTGQGGNPNPPNQGTGGNKKQSISPNPTRDHAVCQADAYHRA